MQTDEMKDLDGIVRDAVKLKYIDKPLTKEQLAELIQIPPRFRDQLLPTARLKTRRASLPR